MTANSKAMVPSYVVKFDNQILANVFAVFAGVLLLSLLSHVAIPLPFTPVPITGQTFAVTLISLLWGMKRATSIVLIYLAVGILGFPVFAFGASGALVGPTAGYLLGMVGSSFVVGKLADMGFAKTFRKALLASYCGSLCVFTFGLLGLSFYAPTESLLYIGVFPFLLGDLIKNILASMIVASVEHKTAG